MRVEPVATSSPFQPCSMMKTVIVGILLCGALLARGQDHEDDVCPTEGMEGFDISKVAGKSWYVAYKFPTAPAISFFQTEKCLKLDISYYADTNQMGLKMQGLDKDNGKVEYEEAVFNLKGAVVVGKVDGLLNIFAFLDTDYDNWAIGKNCFSKNRTILEEEWWVITTAPDGSLGPEEAEAAFHQSLVDRGMTHFFTEQHSFHLEQYQH